MSSVAILVIGVIAIWLLYGEGLQDFHKSGDHYGTEVTIIAMFGSLLPFLGFAILLALPTPS